MIHDAQTHEHKIYLKEIAWRVNCCVMHTKDASKVKLTFLCVMLK